MNIIHIRADGTVEKSIEGTVIRSKEFYEILNAIQKKRSKKKNGKETHHEAAH